VREGVDGQFEVVHHRLFGIASREDGSSPPQITCQGMGRIEATLKEVRRMCGEG
jgi:hypothetical protein